MNNKGKRWQLTEDNLLREKVGKITHMELAKILGRPLSGVDNRVRKLGIANQLKVWASNEIQFLRENYGRQTVRELAKKLFRTNESVAKKAAFLGLSKQITEEERRKVLALAQTTNFTNQNIAQTINRSCASVAKILRENQVKRKQGRRLTNSLLTGFKYVGTGNQSKLRYGLLYAYHNTCWDCKRTFISETDLQIHHDLTKLPVHLLVLCKECHGKRHGVKLRFTPITVKK